MKLINTFSLLGSVAYTQAQSSADSSKDVDFVASGSHDYDNILVEEDDNALEVQDVVDAFTSSFALQTVDNSDNNDDDSDRPVTDADVDDIINEAANNDAEHARGRSSAVIGPNFNKIQKKYLQQLKKLKLSKEEEFDVRQTLIKWHAKIPVEVKRLLHESTTHKYFQNEAAGKDYAALFMEPDTSLATVGTEDVLTIPSTLGQLRALAKIPLTKSFYNLYQCIKNKECEKFLLEMCPLPDPNNFRKSLSFPIVEDGTITCCTQGGGAFSCKSRYFQELEDYNNHRLNFMRLYDLELPLSAEDQDMIDWQMKSGEGLKSSGGKQLRKSKGSKSKKSRKPKAPKGSSSKKKKEKKPKKSKGSGGKKKKKKGSVGWTVSDDGQYICRMGKCKRNPKYVPKEPEPKKPSDLTDTFGKASIDRIISHLAETHATTDLESFKQLVLDGNWIPKDPVTGYSKLKDLFCMVPNVEVVSFKANNIIGRLDDDTFECLKNLKHVDFGENGLYCASHLFDHAFDQGNMEYINFSSNPMQARCFFEYKQATNSRRKYEYVVDPIDTKKWIENGKTTMEEYNRVMKECLNSEPNCVTDRPDLDPDVMGGY